MTGCRRESHGNIVWYIGQARTLTMHGQTLSTNGRTSDNHVKILENVDGDDSQNQ